MLLFWINGINDNQKSYDTHNFVILCQKHATIQLWDCDDMYQHVTWLFYLVSSWKGNALYCLSPCHCIVLFKQQRAQSYCLRRWSPVLDPPFSISDWLALLVGFSWLKHSTSGNVCFGGVWAIAKLGPHHTETTTSSAFCCSFQGHSSSGAFCKAWWLFGSCFFSPTNNKKTKWRGNNMAS